MDKGLTDWTRERVAKLEHHFKMALARRFIDDLREIQNYTGYGDLNAVLSWAQNVMNDRDFSA